LPVSTLRKRKGGKVSERKKRKKKSRRLVLHKREGVKSWIPNRGKAPNIPGQDYSVKSYQGEREAQAAP